MCGELQRVSYGQKALKGQIFKVGYCSLQAESTCTQHSVQLCTGRQVLQWNSTVSDIVTPLYNGPANPTAIF